MDYTITPSEDGQYIIIKVIADITPTIAMRYTTESHKMGREMGIHKYLVDATEAKNISKAFENYRFAYHSSDDIPDFDPLACVAALISPDDSSHDFIETVTKNAGLDVTFFTDREEAVNHLLRSE